MISGDPVAALATSAVDCFVKAFVGNCSLRYSTSCIHAVVGNCSLRYSTSCIHAVVGNCFLRRLRDLLLAACLLHPAVVAMTGLYESTRDSRVKSVDLSPPDQTPEPLLDQPDLQRLHQPGYCISRLRACSIQLKTGASGSRPVQPGRRG